MTKKRALGKGLSALLESVDTEIGTLPRQEHSMNIAGSVIDISISDIEANPFQPRSEFDKSSLNELAASIANLGIIQPLTVRQLGWGKYQLISGERRFRAAQLAGLGSLPCYIRIADDQAMLEMALVENIQRKDLNAIEVSLSYHRLIEECKFTQEQLAARVGKQRSTITNYLRLLKLPAEIQLAVRDEQISMGHARTLINVNDSEEQLALFHKMISEGWTVRQAESEIQGFSKTKTVSKSMVPQEWVEIKNEISAFIGSKVGIKRMSSGMGKLEIHFTSEKDLKKLQARLMD